MATYKEIKGVTIQTNTEDPVVDEGSWSSGSDLSTAREALAGAGIQTAAIVAGGSTGPGSFSDTVEYYNGTSWSEQAEINEAREFVTGSGTQTAALIMAGRDGPNTHPAGVEEWNGTSWTAKTSMGTARRGVGSSVSQSRSTGVMTLRNFCLLCPS